MATQHSHFSLLSLLSLFPLSSFGRLQPPEQHRQNKQNEQNKQKKGERWEKEAKKANERREQREQRERSARKERKERTIMSRSTAILFCVFCFLSVSTISSFGLQKPRALATDSRIKVIAYQKNNVVPVYGTTFINTQLIFGKNETIVDVEDGDAVAWTIKVDKNLSNVLNLKPTVLGSHTNLSVITLDNQGKRRYYHFQLMSNSKPTTNTHHQTYVIRFIYPEEQKAKLLATLNTKKLTKHSIINAYKNPKKYNWDYSFSGSRAIMPLHVFDDGKFTYLQLRHNQPVPAIFAVNNTFGKESVVNYRRVGQYLVIQEVAPQFTLRDGKSHVASIFDNKLIAKRRKQQ